MNKTLTPNLLMVIATVLIAVCFIAFGSTWGWRSAGVVLAIQGIVVCFTRSVPVGWEGQPPSFYLRGAPAFIAGVTFVIGGTLMAWYARALPVVQ